MLPLHHTPPRVQHHRHSPPSASNGDTTVWLAVLALCPSPTALRAAVKLGVFDAPGMSADSGSDPVPVSALATHTSSDPDHLYRLLRYLAAFNIFQEHPGQSFQLTSIGALLRADHPSGLCYAAIAFGEPGHYMPWMHLDKAVREGVCFVC